MRRIAIITGSRADESPLSRVITLLGDSCIHIQTNGLYGHEAFIKATLERESPDMLVILGDRYEILVAASVSALLTIPIVHIHGGETTEGAVDDAFRYAISALSYYHFVSHAKHQARLERLGESPERIFVTGAPGVDALADEPMTREQCEWELGIELKAPLALVCYNPETLGTDDMRWVTQLDSYATVVISGANADAGGDAINDYWSYYERGTYRDSYSQALWISLMHHADALIGNSSGFIFEGMTLGKTVVMIGDRQKGRWQDAQQAFAASKYAYGEPGKVSPVIVDLLLTLPIPAYPRKAFHAA